MDRCKLFAQLTRADDPECNLFEDILDRFYDEYSYLYGAIDYSGFINSVKLSCLNNDSNKLSINISHDKLPEKTLEKFTKFLIDNFYGDFSIHSELNNIIIIFKKR